MTEVDKMNYREEYPNKQWFGIDWERVDRSNLGGLQEDKKQMVEKGIERMNNDLFWVRYMKNQGYNVIPESYHKRAKKIYDEMIEPNTELKGHFKQNASEVVTTIEEESYVLSSEKARVYYENNIAAQIFGSVTRPLGKVKFDVKQYGVKLAKNPVKFSRSFSEPEFTQVTISNQKDTGIGLYAGYSISKMQLLQSEGDLFDLEYELVLETTTQLARAINEHIFTGTTTILGIPMDDNGVGTTNFKGFMNHASNQGFTIGTTSTYGSWIAGHKAALTALKTCRGPGDIITIMSSGCHSQMEANYPSYGHGDWNEFDEIKKRYYGAGKPIQQLWISDKCKGTATSLSAQYMFMLKVDRQFMERLLVLPLQTWASLEKKWSEDIREVMVVADIIRHKLRPNTTVNAFPVALEDAMSTADAGYLEEQRII